MAVTPSPGTDGALAAERLARGCRALGWGSLLGVLALTIAGVPLSGPLGYLPLLVGGALVILPHGALDWAALPLARRGALTATDLARVLGLYLVLGGVTVLAWVVAPAATAIGFLLVTWAHFGQGDAYGRAVFDGRADRSTLARALTVLVRGGIPVVAPLVAAPETYRRVLAAFVAPVGGDLGGLAWLFDSGVRWGAVAGLAALTVLALALGRRREGAGRGWRVDALETTLLWATFLVVPPIAAVGTYLTCWHGPRHVARVWLLDGPSRAAIGRGAWGRPLKRLARLALVPTVGGFGIIAALWLAAPVTPAAPVGVLGLWLVGIAVMTVPHVAVVTWLDRLGGPADAPAAD